MYLIDTNIFLEILLEQEKAEDCSLFLQKVRKGNIKAVVSTFSIHSISVILSSLGKFTELEEFLSDIEYFKGLSIFNTTITQEIEITKLAQKEKLDFDDALHFWIAKNFNLKIVSFDKHFDKLRIKKVEPSEIIQHKRNDFSK